MSSEDTGTVDPARALTRVLHLTGLGFPRGVIGTETAALAAALRDGRDGDVAGLVGVSAAALWPELRPSTAAAVARAADRADEADAPSFALVREWAESDDPDNPLARCLTLRAATDLAAALDRAVTRIEGVSQTWGGPDADAAVAHAAGLIAVDLLDLDPDDFEPEIAAYVEAGEGPDALRELARATGDVEVREWAREAVAALNVAAPDPELRAVRELAAKALPEDPALDPVWVAAIQSLADQAIAFVLASEQEGSDGIE